ncbi:hypothetical protein B0H16DRAFT_1879596 [Mycena metata]|uniref:Apple domain-containing protein n=1 Tax=Mycena metata TaxID=1033252 RepID=A0AAD7K3A2_9AGAR|nr:hypothetical protein B0H16DRAFT_1430027 [Mycena metata]KAJ7776194.1 hypothetical protein B0H16DRAFT_1879596 [Mycena metata]
MRFTAAFSALAVIATGVSAASFSSDSISSAITLTSSNHYGAPTPPWQAGHHPGWYYGKSSPPSGIICLVDELICDLLRLFPFCLQCPKAPPPPPHYPPPPPHYPPSPPPPPPGYSQSFYNLTCAAQDYSYQTYGLVDTVADCQYMCDSVAGCTFFNTYYDVNGKGGSTQLTCSLFSKCLDASSADNCGGQTQPDGSVDYITQSAGYCKTY